MTRVFGILVESDIRNGRDNHEVSLCVSMPIVV